MISKVPVVSQIPIFPQWLLVPLRGCLWILRKLFEGPADVSLQVHFVDEPAHG